VKQYYKVKDSKTEIKVSTGYELGGMNYFSGAVNKRGYYLYAQPVERSDSNGFRCESTKLFSGFKVMLVEVSRKGKKAEATAEALAMEQAQRYAEQLAGQLGMELSGEHEEVA
jgi:hypothetical protein